MAPFFSYRTFSECLRCYRSHGILLERSLRLDEGAESRDRFADDQVLHLERSFIGVERFGVGKETRDVVVRYDSVAAKQLARPRDCLAGSGGAEPFGERRVLIRQLAFVVEIAPGEAACTGTQ